MWDEIDAQRYGYKAGQELFNQTEVNPKVVSASTIKKIAKAIFNEYNQPKTAILERNFIKGFKLKGWGSR